MNSKFGFDGDDYESKIITIEEPSINHIKQKYESITGEQKTIEFKVTDEQINFIDAVAQKFDISFQCAYEMVWKDSFDLLMNLRKVTSTYSNLPGIDVKSKVVG